MADQDSNFDLSALAAQMDKLAVNGDQNGANQLLASLAQAPSGADAAPKLDDPLMNAAKASRANQSAPMPPPDFSGMSVGSQTPPIFSTPDTMQSRPMVEGGGPAGALSQVPGPTVGGLPGLIWNLVSPNHRAAGTAQGQLAPTKLQSFESFLTNFLTSLSEGFKNEGTGPGSFGRGMAAAVQAPYQQALQQHQIQQQSQANQAQIESERVKNQLTQAQIQQMQTSIPIRMPDGSVVYAPAKDAGRLLGSVAGAQGKLGAAQIAANNRLSVEEMKAQLANGKVVKTLPAQDANGVIGVMGYNAQGEPIGFMQGALPPSSYMPKTSTTTDYIQTDGGLMAVPKSTTTSPQLPSGASSLPPSIQQKIAGNKANKVGGTGQLPPQVQTARNQGGPRLVTGPDGKPVYSKSGPTSMTGIEDPFGNTVGTTESGVTLTKPEYLAAQKTFNKDYVEDLNKLAKTQTEFESIRDDPNQSGAQKVTGLLAAVGISGNALKGNGFRISQQIIDEHANARNIWQGFVQKWNKVAGSGGPITSQQIADYTKIAQGVVHDSYVQAAREARRQGLPVDFLPQATSQGQRADDGILRIYVDSANGDVQKAHKALTAAGWR